MHLIEKSYKLFFWCHIPKYLSEKSVHAVSIFESLLGSISINRYSLRYKASENAVMSFILRSFSRWIRMCKIHKNPTLFRFVELREFSSVVRCNGLDYLGKLIFTIFLLEYIHSSFY